MSLSPNPSPAPAAPEPSPAASPISRPDYIPAKYWDETAAAPRVEDLGKAYQSLETKLGKGKEAYDAERLARRPEAADKYELALDGYDKDTIEKFPLTGVLKEISFDLGLPPEEANTVASKVIGALLKDMPDPAKEKEALGPQAEQRLQAIDAYLTETFPDEAERKAFEFIGRNAAGVRAIEKLIAQAKGVALDPPRDTGAPPAAGTLSREQLQTMMKDERYWHPHKKDRAFVAQIQAGFEKLNGAS